MPEGQRECQFEWNLTDYSSVVDDSFYDIVNVAPGTKVDFLDFMHMIHPDDRESVATEFQDHLEKGGLKHRTFRLAVPDPKWIYTEANVLLDPYQRPFFMKGIIRELPADKIEEG